MIEILRPGLQTTIQDLGRYGWMHLGISHSGAMDKLSMQLANRLLGMPENNAVLEMTQVGPDIRFNVPMAIAITGADMQFKLNGKPVPTYQVVSVSNGDVLKYHGCRKGFRAYLGFSGKLNIQPVLGARSTQLNAGIGGLNGAALRQGDVLTVTFNNHSVITSNSMPTVYYSGHYQIRYTPAPEAELFSAENLSQFQSESFKVSQQLNRMGIRLEGLPLQKENYPLFDSRGLLPGAIQIPPDGSPIIAGMDAQTTGGYVRIGQVIQADMPVVGQLKPGDDVKFLQISLEQAQQIYQAQRALLR